MLLSLDAKVGRGPATVPAFLTRRHLPFETYFLTLRTPDRLQSDGLRWKGDLPGDFRVPRRQASRRVSGAPLKAPDALEKVLQSLETRTPLHVSSR